ARPPHQFLDATTRFDRCRPWGLDALLRARERRGAVGLDLCEQEDWTTGSRRNLAPDERGSPPPPARPAQGCSEVLHRRCEGRRKSGRPGGYGGRLLRGGPELRAAGGGREARRRGGKCTRAWRAGTGVRRPRARPVLQDARSVVAGRGLLHVGQERGGRALL